MSFEKKYNVEICGDKILNFLVYIGVQNRLFKEDQLGDVSYLSIKESRGLRISKWENDFRKALKIRFEDRERFDDLYSYPKFNGIDDEDVRAECTDKWDEFDEWWSMPAGGNSAMEYITRCKTMLIDRVINECPEDSKFGILITYIDFKGIIEGQDYIALSANSYIAMTENDIRGILNRKIS